MESVGRVTAQIEVSEADIGFVTVGSPVRLRANAFYDRVFEGKVELIDRKVTGKAATKGVLVVALVDNADDALKTGMTGFANVEAGTLPVWKAFTQALLRFLCVQVWSWVP